MVVFCTSQGHSPCATREKHGVFSSMERHRVTLAHFTLAAGLVLIPLPVSHSAVVPGHVETWGRDLFGETDVPPGLDGVIAVAGGFSHSLALRTNGTVVAWGSDNNGESAVQVPSGLSNVVAIAAGGSGSAAVKADGTVVVWGSNISWLTNVPPEAVGVSTVDFVGSAVLALRTNGTVVAWGIGNETNVPPGLSDVVQVSGVNGHVLALTRQGVIVGWGGNFYGQAAHPPGLTNVVRIGAGQEVSFALRSDGTLFRWGSPFALPGNPPPLTNVVDFDVGNQHAVALLTDGTVAAWGDNPGGQTDVPWLLNGITGISAGGNHNLVITARPIIQSFTPPVMAQLGSNVTLTVVASGEPLSYQWQHNHASLFAATNASLTIENLDPSRAGNYAVYVVNSHGYNYAATSISRPPPNITAQPAGGTFFRGEIAILSAAVTGLPPFTYQWFRDGAAIPNETNAVITVPTSGREDSSVYHVRVTDTAGGVTISSNAQVTVFDPRPASVALRPVLDTSIYSSGTNPLGTATLLSGTRVNGIHDRALLRFDPTSVPTNAVIEAAMLRLALIRAPRGGGAESTFGLHRALRPWDADATWTNASSAVAWSAPGGAPGIDYATNDVAQASFSFGSGEYVFGGTNELLADIAAWIQNPAANYGWFLISAQEASGGSARHLGASESPTPPTLMLRYSVPAPAPTIHAARLESNNFVFTFDGAAGWIYNMETREEIDRGVWTAFTNAPAGAAQTPIVITVPLTNSHQFFRAFRY